MDSNPRKLRPAAPANWFWRLAGLAALAGNKLRHTIRPYSRPRPFAGDAQAAADYDASVFRGWRQYLRRYLGRDYDWTGKAVLELGPGPDLGAGLLALAAGAAEYTAFDKFPLARRSGAAVYELLLAQARCSDEDAAELLRAVDAALAGTDGRLRYVQRADFDISAAELPRADVVVSQAAFEHFDDPRRTIEQLGDLTERGAVFLAVADFQTHTRWLRRRDPLNIYRYSPGLYSRLRFSGGPNRARGDELAAWLADAGWGDIRVTPLLELDADYLAAVAPHLAEPFRRDAAAMHILTAVVCATRQ